MTVFMRDRTEANGVPWIILSVAVAVCVGVIYALYAFGPRWDMVLLLGGGVAYTALGGDPPPTDMRLPAKIIGAIVLTLLLWWGGFWGGGPDGMA